MDNIFTVKDNKLLYRTVRGTVLSSEKLSETVTRGNGITSRINHRIWLQADSGEDDFLFYDSDIPLREHQDVTITLVSANGNDYYPAALANHTTGENYVAQNSRLERALGLTYRAHRKIKIYEVHYDELAYAPNPILKLLINFVLLWLVASVFIAAPVGLFIAMKYGFSAVFSSYIQLSIIIGVIMLLRLNLGITYTRDMRQEYHEKLLSIMDSLDNQSLDKPTVRDTTTETEIDDFKPQVEIIHKPQSATEAKEQLAANYAQPVFGSFVINTKNYEQSLIEKFIALPQTMANNDISAIQTKALFGVGLRFFSIFLFLLSIDWQKLSFQLEWRNSTGWAGRSLFVTPAVLFFIIAGIALQLLAIKSLQKISHSKSILQNAIIYNVLFIMPLIQIYWWQKWIFLTFVSYIVPIAFVFYAYKYYQKLSAITEQTCFMAVFGVYAISEVLCQAEIFIFWGIFFINIIALILEFIAWSKVNNINKCN